jgi:hypothetical protein
MADRDRPAAGSTTMSPFLARWLWVGVIVAIALGIVAAIWLAGLAAGSPVPPPAIG